MPGEATVLIGEREVMVTANSLVRFACTDRDGVVGLGPDDMGISTVAGSVRREWDVWWLENHSRKRRLLLDDGSGGALLHLDCGQRTPIDEHTHRVDVVVPTTNLVRLGHRSPAGTAAAHGLRLDERDIDVLVVLLADSLDAFPARPTVPRTYQEAADVLGPPWTKASVRRRIAQLKHRAARAGTGFLGPFSNYDLVDQLVVNALLGPADRDRLSRTT